MKDEQQLDWIQFQIPHYYIQALNTWTVSLNYFKTNTSQLVQCSEPYLTWNWSNLTTYTIRLHNSTRFENSYAYASQEASTKREVVQIWNDLWTCRPNLVSDFMLMFEGEHIIAAQKHKSIRCRTSFSDTVHFTTNVPDKYRIWLRHVY